MVLRPASGNRRPSSDRNRSRSGWRIWTMSGPVPRGSMTPRAHQPPIGIALLLRDDFQMRRGIGAQQCGEPGVPAQPAVDRVEARAALGLNAREVGIHDCFIDRAFRPEMIMHRRRIDAELALDRAQARRLEAEFGKMPSGGLDQSLARVGPRLVLADRGLVRFRLAIGTHGHIRTIAPGGLNFNRPTWPQFLAQPRFRPLRHQPMPPPAALKP